MTTDPFAAAHRLAPVPDEHATIDAWVRHYAAQALAAWTVFDREVKFHVDHRTQGDRPEIGYLSMLGVASTHAAVALSSVHRGPIYRGPITTELYDLTPEAGALNGEWEEWLTDRLDLLGINPADINDEYVAGDFRSPSRAQEVA